MAFVSGGFVSGGSSGGVRSRCYVGGVQETRCVSRCSRRSMLVMQDVAAVPEKMETKVQLDELKPGTEMEGMVRTVTTYGAFVDVGAGTDGLLHVSQMSNSFVKDPNDIVTVGQTINVRVLSVDLEKGNFSLTMRAEGAQNERRAGGGSARSGRSSGEDRTPRPSWDSYDIPDEKKFIEGKVVSITDFGAFVNFGGPTDGMVHISSISADRVESVKSVLSVGQTVQVRVQEADPARNRVSLSMTPWVPEEERKTKKRAGPRFSEPVDVEGRATSEELSKFMEGQPEHETPFAIAWNRAQKKQ